MQCLSFFASTRPPLSRKNQLQQACKVHVPLGVQWVTDQFACRVAIFTNNRRIGPLFGEVPTATSLGPSSWKTSSVAVVADGLSFRSNYKEVIQASWTVFDQYYSSCLLIFYDSFFYLPGVCPSHHIYCNTLKWSHVHKVFNLIWMEGRDMFLSRFFYENAGLSS